MTFPSAGLYGPEAVLTTTGAPAPGASVTVYNHGTVVAANLYTDQTKGAAATNPVLTDSFGNLVFYAVPGVYDLSFTVGGVPTVRAVEVSPWYSDVAAAADLAGYTKQFGRGALVGAMPGSPVYVGQGGSPTLTVTGSNTVNVTFPAAFANALCGLVACAGDSSAGMTQVQILFSTVTLAGFSAWVGGPTGTGIASTSLVRVNWEAQGC
jgi:hypothetical protein